jgi:hypothetical protein
VEADEAKLKRAVKRYNKLHATAVAVRQKAPLPGLSAVRADPGAVALGEALPWRYDLVFSGREGGLGQQCKAGLACSLWTCARGLWILKIGVTEAARAHLSENPAVDPRFEDEARARAFLANAADRLKPGPPAGAWALAIFALVSTLGGRSA